MRQTNPGEGHLVGAEPGAQEAGAEGRGGGARLMRDRDPPVHDADPVLADYRAAPEPLDDEAPARCPT